MRNAIGNPYVVMLGFSPSVINLTTERTGAIGNRIQRRSVRHCRFYIWPHLVHYDRSFVVFFQFQSYEMHKNVEMKAKCDRPERIRTLLKRRGADHRGTDHQVDTYFDVDSGRLKLREGEIENHLIYYERPDRPEPKEADIYLYETEPGTELKALLEAALGVKVVVEKRRDIYFIDNVKFHVDEVEGLGTFMEIEAIDTSGDSDVEQLRSQCQHFLNELEIKQEQLVSISYSDLLLNDSGRDS